ncbi:MAG: hypothetical protein FK734_06515 [Asgard group archaeon]|nr:hypothetical protein [Asgard group archaeon]
MIQFIWIIIKDTPATGMRFIKISDQEERSRLEKFYGWLSGPVSEFTEKVQDIIIDGTKYYYHTRSDVLFVVGTDLEETSIPSVFLPELEELFFEQFPEYVAKAFDPKDISSFRVFDKTLTALVKAFIQRKIESAGSRKDLDAFEVLNLPSEFQMVALVLVKMQVVTPDMVSQVTGIPANDVERQLREIYDKGYLFITKISNKSYYSIKPFESDEGTRIITPRSPQTTSAEEIAQLNKTDDESSTQTAYPSFDTTAESEVKKPKFDFSDVEISQKREESTQDSIGSAMMPPMDWEKRSISAESSFGFDTQTREDIGETITPQIDKEEDEEGIKIRSEQKGIKLKEDPIAKEIDLSHQETIIIPKNGFLPPNSLRREKGFNTGKIRIPSDRNKDSFILMKRIKRDFENIIEALFMGDFLVITGEEPELNDEILIDSIFENLQILAPHRELECVKSTMFIHPKEADVIAIPEEQLKYYSWATIIDITQNKVIGGKSSDFSKNLVKKIKKLDAPKDLLKELTNSASILLKVARDINTLKIEGRPPDLYLNEVKKTFGVVVLDAGLALSERLIRLHKDCAYIAGFYIRKGLDIVVRAIILGEPIVVIGDDPIDVYHIIEALAIFAPHKAINAQIWTTNFAGIASSTFDIMGAQEGTDKLFKEAVKVNLRSMNAYGGPRSEYLHTFLRKMWRRRSKDRPKFIRDNIIEMINNINKIVQKVQAMNDKKPSKQTIKEIFAEFDDNFDEFVIDFIQKLSPSLAEKIAQGLK